MLNEIQEVKEYFINPAINDTRIMTSIFWGSKKDCQHNGISRVLTTLARFFLFDVYEYHTFSDDTDNIDYDEQAKIIRKVSSALKLWFGFKIADEDVLSKDDIDLIHKTIQKKLGLKKESYIFEGWYKSFCKNKFEGEKRENYKCTIENHFDYKINTELGNKKKKRTDKAGKNDFKSVSAERVIASAVNLGPLRNYCVIFNEKLMKNTLHKDTVLADKLGSKKGPEFLDNLIKITAYYILQQQDTPQWGDHPATEIVNNKADLSHWLGKNITNTMLSDFSFITDAKGKSQPVFIIFKYNDSIAKFAVNPAFIQLIEMQIFNITDKEEKSKYQKYKGQKKYFCLEDNGKLPAVISIKY